MEQISNEMASEYSRIQKRATEDPGTAGDQGEENWAELLRDWLPSSYRVVTKGRIISHDGRTSPQIDILVLKSSYPKKLESKKIYLAAGVAAAFECKVTLKSQDIAEAISTCQNIKSLYKKRIGTPYKELHSPIIYGLLAHSHSWKGENSTPIENIQKKIIEEDYSKITHPINSLDLLCVADLGMWSIFKTTFTGPKHFPDWSLLSDMYGPDGSATSGYVGFTHQVSDQETMFTPMGSLIFNLSLRLAWENSESRDLADYYRETNLSGSGNGFMRKWPSSIYSKFTREKVEAGNYSKPKSWDEWAVQFFTS
ncbi:hypothetical protein SOPP22_16790 [Shewanella sp. OPT22]|nr:hypothetical protein SOPP22_16790 [Shewanella sp. OPT22]